MNCRTCLKYIPFHIFYNMAGLLDSIFLNLDLTHLTRKEVEEYLLYLEEIITKTLKTQDQVKYLSYKVKLNGQLVKLDKEFVLNLRQISRFANN